MDILIIGLNHKSAGIGEREIVSKKLLTPELRLKFYESIKELKDEAGGRIIAESAVLTTCNRSEFIFSLSPSHTRSGKGHLIKNFISDYFFSPDSEKEDIFYMFLNKDAVMHLFKVASSLDSMVVGEPQILGQIKDAYNESCDFKMAGPALNKLFHKTFYCAKKVRTETKIASSPVSISYAAVELSRKIFNNLQEKKILLLGAGETGRLTLRHFIKFGVRNIHVANRTREKAFDFIEEAFEPEEKKCLNVIDFSEYFRLLPSSDIILCSTSSDEYVLKYGDIMPIIKLRKQKPLFLIDISVPRNIDPEVNKISNVYLFDIDDIGKMIEGNMETRKKESENAEGIIHSIAKEFLEWKESLNVVPVIVSLRNKVKDVLERELSNYIEKKDEKDLIINSITNKILHEPVTLIKKTVRDSDGPSKIEMLKSLFNLGAEGEKDEEAPGNRNKKGSKPSKNHPERIKLIK